MKMNPMKLMMKTPNEASADGNITTTTVTVQSKVVTAPKQVWLHQLTHDYTRAIYSRVKRAFNSNKISANSNFSFFSNAAGIPSTIVNAVDVSKEEENTEDLIDAGQESIEEILHEIQSASTWTRFVKLRGFLVRTWVLFVLFNHPFFSIFTKFDPRNPRYLRMLMLSVILIGNLWTTTFLFAFVNEGGGITTFIDSVVMALLSSLLQVPMSLIIALFIRYASVAEFDSRYPYVAAELRRRARVEKFLSKMSPALLEAELKSVSLENEIATNKHRLSGLRFDGLGVHKKKNQNESAKKSTTTKYLTAHETANHGRDDSRLRLAVVTTDNVDHLSHTSSSDACIIVPNVSICLDSTQSSLRVDIVDSTVSVAEGDFDEEMISKSTRFIVSSSNDDIDKEMSVKFQKSLRVPHSSRKSYFGPIMKNQANSHGLVLEDDDENNDTSSFAAPTVSPFSSSYVPLTPIPSDLASLHVLAASSEPIHTLEPKASFSEEAVHTAVAEDFEIMSKDSDNADEVAGEGDVDEEKKVEAGKKDLQSNDFSYGWINAPPDLQRNFPGLLWCCGRHPDQCDGYIARMKKLEEQKQALIEKKKIEAQIKRNKRNKMLSKNLQKKKEDDHAKQSSEVTGTNAAGAGISVQDASFTARNSSTTAVGMNALSPLTATTPPTSQRDNHDDHSDYDDHTDRGVSDNLGDYQGSGDDTGDNILVYLVWIFSPLWALICNHGRVINRMKTESLESIVQSSRRNLNAAKGVPIRTLSDVDSVIETQESILRQAHAKVSFVTILPCTVSMLIAIIVSCLIIGFQIFYISLFGFRHDEKVTLTLTFTWALTQAWSLFIIEPGMSFVELIIIFIIKPAWLPYLLWIPHLGPFVAGKVAADMVINDGRSVLSGRMQNLTLVKAAGAASQLSPELAVVAYGFGAVISATLSNVEDNLLTLTKNKKTGDQTNLKEQLSAASKLSRYQRNDLIVHRYILAQLHSVEEAQRSKKALAMKLAKAASVKGKKRIIRNTHQDVNEGV